MSGGVTFEEPPEVAEEDLPFYENGKNPYNYLLRFVDPGKRARPIISINKKVYRENNELFTPFIELLVHSEYCISIDLCEEMVDKFNGLYNTYNGNNCSVPSWMVNELLKDLTPKVERDIEYQAEAARALLKKKKKEKEKARLRREAEADDDSEESEDGGGGAAAAISDDSEEDDDHGGSYSDGSDDDDDEGGSTADMLDDNHPPSFDMEDWEFVRDELYSFGRPFRADASDPRQRLYRAALAMNLIQEDYQTRLSVVGTQGGRLFPERIVYFCLRRPAQGPADTLAKRIKQLRGTQYEDLEADLHLLRKFGNRVDHDELPDLRAREKPEVVDAVYRVASQIVDTLEDFDSDGD